MGDGTIVYRILARNTARESPNKMHDDRVAKDYGFAGGLVPGVAIFAWMCGPPLDEFGERWLSGGTIDARFHEPVYEGDEVTVEGRPDGDRMSLAVRGAAEGPARASGAAASSHDPDIPDPASFARGDIPASPPPASADSLTPGRTLGTLDVRFEAARVAEYLESIGATHPAISNLAHPGWLLVLANLALSANVSLGPWIHVSSDVRLHGAVRDGEPVSAFARVAEEFERKGHRFVALDILMTAAGRLAASVRHVAIYQPRRQA